MKLNRMKGELGDPAEEQYLIEEISEEDIVPVTEHLRDFVQKLEGFSFLNYFTLDELTEQAKKQFTIRKT